MHKYQHVLNIWEHILSTLNAYIVVSHSSAYFQELSINQKKKAEILDI